MQVRKQQLELDMEQQTGSKQENIFNLYAEYIMRNTGLDDAQAGIKIARRNINSLRYAVLLQLMKVKSESEVAQSCPTLRDPMDCSLTGYSVHGIFQARVLEWGATVFSYGILPKVLDISPQLKHPFPPPKTALH